MNKALGSFEGRVVDVAELKISGGSDDRVGTLTHGEQIYFVGKATISKISHEEKSLATRGFTRRRPRPWSFESARMGSAC